MLNKAAIIFDRVSAVRLIRSFVDLDLPQCCAIVDAWAFAYGLKGFIGWDCNDPVAVMRLGKMAKLVASGDWKIVNGVIIVTRPLENRDIFSL